MSEKTPELTPRFGLREPTNGDAAKRPYCRKHSRAMLDIGGEKKCTACRDEELARRKRTDAIAEGAADAEVGAK